MKILIIHGANLKYLGSRQECYGNFTYDELVEKIKKFALDLGAETEFFVSNSEGEIIDRLWQGDFDALIINPGAFSHYSLAIADALMDLKKPKIEVHITNIHSRGRHTLVTGAQCDGVICGLKEDGYLAAISVLFNILNNK